MIMTIINSICELSFGMQLLIALPLSLMSAGVLYLIAWGIMALAYRAMENLNTAMEREVYDAEWMDWDAWAEEMG